MADSLLAVLGLGYVGLPLAAALSRKRRVIGFDIHAGRIEELRRGVDRSREVTSKELSNSNLFFTSDPRDLADVAVFFVTVPTPIHANHQPDLGPLVSATETIAAALRPGGLVVYESTVYPGVTEEVCVPILEARSGLRWKQDFHVAYSPERINPGDREHRLDTVTKVVSGDTDATVERVAALYGAIAPTVHRAASIKVAEAAKVIENTQRDLNIALMNELAVIFDRMGIRTADVLNAAGTKWNFLRFSPGLVGGHCIGVDPYYLTAKAESLGYHPEVILAGRRINDNMGRFIAQKTVKLLGPRLDARIGVVGLAFKENVPDLRNSRVPDLVAELREFGLRAWVHDPVVDGSDAMHEHGIELVSADTLVDLDALILAVPHREVLANLDGWLGRVLPGGVVVDVKSVIDPARLPTSELRLWSL
jgi:UDP-N-acetyl-D-galactosamine dehydrogenase